MKIYIASPSKCFLLFFSHWSIHLFQNNRILRPTRSVKLYIFRINLPCMAFATPRYLSPVSTVSATNAWDYDPPFWGSHTRKKKEKKRKRNACIFWLSPLKQARLKTASILDLQLPPLEMKMIINIVILTPTSPIDVHVPTRTALGAWFLKETR